MNKQPELHTTNLLMQPLSISFENAALQILRFSKIHENTHAWVIPLHTHPTIELHYILSGAGQIQIDDTLWSCRRPKKEKQIRLRPCAASFPVRHFPLPERRMSCCRCCCGLTGRRLLRSRSFCRRSSCICGVCLIFWVYYRR